MEKRWKETEEERRARIKRALDGKVGQQIQIAFASDHYLYSGRLIIMGEYKWGVEDRDGVLMSFTPDDIVTISTYYELGGQVKKTVWIKGGHDAIAR